MKQEAVSVNKSSRQGQLAAVDVPQTSLVHCAPSNIHNLASLADEHYAISAKQVDLARSQCQGNWVKQSHSEFRAEHQRIIEHTGPEDNESDIDQAHCQCVLGPGMCRMQIEADKPESVLFHTLLNQAKNALRLFRSVRRDKGYRPDHAPLILVESLPDDQERKLDLYFLVRLSFSPLDATAMRWTWNSEQTACVKITNGLPEFYTLNCCIYNISLEHTGKQVRFKTAQYIANSLCEIRVTQMIDHEHTAMLDEPSSSSDDDCPNGDVAKRMQLLRVALGKARARGRGRGRGRSKVTQPSSTKRAKSAPPAIATDKQQQQRQQLKNAGEGSKDSSDIADGELMDQWESALSTQLGPVPPLPLPEKKSSLACPASSSTATAGNADCPIPIISFAEPWRDTKGYCWIYSVETKKPYPLGGGLMLYCAAACLFVESNL